jgi:YidC/Oxa1 family membrane protein insertase
MNNRSTTIGLALIFLIFFAWLILNQPKKQPTPPPAKPVAADTAQKPGAITSPRAAETSVFFKPDSAVTDVEKKIETPLVSATVSSKGGAISSWVLKNYKTWDQKPLDLIDQSLGGKHGDVHLRVIAADGKLASTRDLNFTIDDPAPATLSDSNAYELRMHATLDSAAAIEKILRFTGNNYLVGVEYRLIGLQGKITGYRYSLVTDNSLPFAEEHSEQELAPSRAFVVMADDVEEIDATADEPANQSFNGDVKYVASRSKYFLQALIPVSPRPVSTEVNGVATQTGGRFHEAYRLTATVPIGIGVVDSVRTNYYLGPLEYYRVSELEPPLDRTMDFGWTFLVRPISIYILLPFFMFLHSFISNWGLVIIVFSTIIKLLTMPLSRGQMKSMRKMQTIMPQLNEVKEKYKDDPKLMQTETFKLYREYGVNPAGGCLPLLLQMPILFALYSVLVNVIELRQAPFAFWINDLSVPDILINFGSTSIPLLGSHLSGLTLLMGATMIIQTASQATDPRQKKMAYIMPILFTFLFNNLPSGVALYYFMFNLFGIAQQVYNKKFLPPLTLESLRAEAKNKKGFMARMQEMEKTARSQRQAAMQGKKLPGPKKPKKY